jgi:hypothetical protein
MKQLARPLMLLAAMTACTPSTRTAAERQAEAARADSSAAGYEVGAKGPAATSSGSAHASVSNSVPDSAKHPVTGASPAALVTPGPGATISPPVKPPPRRPPTTVADTPGGRQGGRGSHTGVNDLPPIDSVLEATFLAFDTLKKSATFQLTADTEVPDQLSFNGSRSGGRVLTIPLGWRIGIEFTNRDAELPHSAIVVAGLEPVPEQLPLPAFPQAQTAKVDAGLLEGDSDEISFVADRAGRYMIACGVMGHAERGQWMVLEVSSTAKVPTYR